MAVRAAFPISVTFTDQTSGVSYADMVYATQYGFATIGTNNGHFGDTGQYFLNNPEVIEDFAYRALHTGTVVGKALTKLFYPQGYKNSYYLGCSTGGRQGMEVHPEISRRL